MSTLEPCSRPRGAFHGVNFLTPHVRGYYRRKVNGRTVYVEVSVGEWRGRGLYGVSFRYSDGSRLDPSLSRSFDSIEDAMRHAREARQ